MEKAPAEPRFSFSPSGGGDRFHRCRSSSRRTVRLRISCPSGERSTSSTVARSSSRKASFLAKASNTAPALSPWAAGAALGRGAGRPAGADFLLGMLTAACLLLFLRGLLGSTDRGRRLLARLQAFKNSLVGKGAA